MRSLDRLDGHHDRHKDAARETDVIEVGIDLTEYYLSVEWDILKVYKLLQQQSYTVYHLPPTKFFLKFRAHFRNAICHCQRAYVVLSNDDIHVLIHVCTRHTDIGWVSL